MIAEMEFKTYVELYNSQVGERDFIMKGYYNFNSKESDEILKVFKSMYKKLLQIFSKK